MADAAERAAVEVRVRIAARALGRHGLAHAYGHVSARLDAATFLVCAAEPMGLIPPGMPGVLVSVDGPLPDGVLGEVRIHQAIYRSRPDVTGVARSMPPKTMSLSALGRTAQACHGFGAYFWPRLPLWDDPLLLRSDDEAERLAAAIGQAFAIVMRGNGLVTLGTSLEEAVVRAWYAEDAARVELDVLAAVDAPLFTEAQATVRATWSGRILERMWDYLTAGDPERS